MADSRRRVHFVGIGGIGMSGIAELLANLGYEVSGSDARTTDITRRLAGMGVRVHEGHAAGNIGDADVVVVTSAVRADNPEIVEARRRGVPVIPRAGMLAELMRLRRTGIPIVETWDITDAPVDMLVGFSQDRVGRAVGDYFRAKGWQRVGIATAGDPRALQFF